MQLNLFDQPKQEVKTIYTCLDDSITEILEHFQSDPLCFGLTIYKLDDGRVQVSGNMRAKNSWNVVIGDNITDCLVTLLEYERRARHQ